MIQLRQVSTDGDIAVVASLAKVIWSEHFTPIIGRTQVEHMLRTIQSHEAVSRQIRHDGYEYDLMLVEEEPVGYVALVKTNLAQFQLSKLYVRKDQRGRGVAKRALEEIETRVRARGANELWLTVNRHNRTAIAFYEQAGFAVTGELVTDIGEGFVMDDYRMAKHVARHPDS